ncbi:amidohydrolase family protein, partial [candidate division KSB1 bacterium]
MKRVYFYYIMLYAGAAMLLAGCAKPYDIIISGGTVIDGTGSGRFSANIGIKDGVINKVGDIDENDGAAVIDARNRIVAPGFIDMHTHSDRDVRDQERKSALNYLAQGVTTMVTGNCGGGTYNIGEFYDLLETQGVGTNIVHLVGHGTVRSDVTGNEDRQPTDAELNEMKNLVEKAMKEGAAGMSSGLFYAPGSYAETDEVVQLAEVVGRYGGFYASHIRDESNYTIGLQNSISEAIEVGEKAGIPVQISHIKALGKPVWGQAEEVCRLIESAHDRGVTVYADQYPYNASSTSLGA